MKHYRMQDAVARLSRVNLQSTVSVLNALYVISKALQEEGEPGMSELHTQLEAILSQSSWSSNGEHRGLRATPDEDDVRGCYRVCYTVEQRCLPETRLIQRSAPVEVFDAKAQSQTSLHH